MSPEAIELARQRARISVRELSRAFRVLSGRERAKQAASGARQSAHAAIFRDLGREELLLRARAALDAFVRLVDLDDAEPSEETYAEGSKLIRWVVHDLSTDVDKPMLEAEALMSTGRQLTLADARADIVEDIELELQTLLFGRRQSRLPIRDLLRAPRYAHVHEQLEKADSLATGANPDYANALKEGMSAVESLARIVTPGAPSTLSDALKKLRSLQVLPTGLDKAIEGLSTYLNNLPWVRHGQPTGGAVTIDDWLVARPLVFAAVRALLQVDSRAPV